MLEVRATLPRRSFELSVDCAFPSGLSGLFGPSGAGKSSLFALIAGLIRPTQGRIALGDDVFVDATARTWVSPRKRRVGVVFQDGRLFPHMTVEKNLRYGERLVPPGQRRVPFGEVVSLLELAPLLRARPRHCSGGERQRVALGRALLSSPRLLLLDEPFAGLDRDLREQLLPFLRRVRNLLDIPTLVISHDLELLLRLTPHLTVIRDGRILASGTHGENPQLDALLDQSRRLRSGAHRAGGPERTAGLASPAQTAWA